jgi:hypothetical protein
VPADLRQCDACGKRVKGNLTPEPHVCDHGSPCKPRSDPETCAQCKASRTLLLGRRLGIELVKGS